MEIIKKNIMSYTNIIVYSMFICVTGILSNLLYKLVENVDNTLNIYTTYTLITITISYIINLFVIYLIYKKNMNKIFILKEKYMNISNKLYNIQIIVSVLLFCVFTLFNVYVLKFKDFSIQFFLIYISICLINASIVYVYNKYKFMKLLKKLKITDEKYDIKNSYIKSGIKELIPIFIAIICIVANISYSEIKKERINYIKEIYNLKIKNFLNIYNDQDINLNLKYVEKIDENDNIYLLSNKENENNITFENDSKNIVIYDYTDYNNNKNQIIVEYNLNLGAQINTILIISISIVVIYSLIVYVYLKYNKDIFTFLISMFENINYNLKKDILKEDIIDNISIISNDEFGKLSMLYNELNTLTDEYVIMLKEREESVINQNKLISIGELAGGVAHDINTPISAIKNGILVLKELNSNRNKEEEDIIKNIENCSEKIIKIVNSMRNQIRNLGENVKINFSIKDVLYDVKNIVDTHAKKNNTTVNIKITDEFNIVGNPTRLSQVITNLVLNAIEAYEGKKGNVDIELIKAPKNTAIIKVTDYAGGLGDEIKKGIFKKVITTKGMSGTGFGLYISHSIIKGDFKGDIKYDTKQGEGTTFYIILPLKNN